MLHTNVYRGLRGVTSSSGQGGLLTIYDPLLVTEVSQPGHLFLRNKKIKADTLKEEIIKMLQHLPFSVLLFSFFFDNIFQNV